MSKLHTLAVMAVIIRAAPHNGYVANVHFSLSTSGFFTASGRGFGMNPAGGLKGSDLGMKPGGLRRGFCFVGNGLGFLAGMKPGGGVNRFCLGAGM